MLTVDPVKRATISEIRNMPIFECNLPRYLQPLPEIDTYPTLPMDDMATLLMINEGQADPKKVADANGMMFSEDLGIIDPIIVSELLERISTYTEAMVWDALQQQGDNQVKVAYQLVRDHKRILKGCKSVYTLHQSMLTISTRDGGRLVCDGRFHGFFTTRMERRNPQTSVDAKYTDTRCRGGKRLGRGRSRDPRHSKCAF